MTSMLAVRKAAPIPGVELADLPRPQPAADELLIQVRRSGICGSDKHLYLWDEWAAGNYPTPFTLGHELVGEVADMGAQVRGFAPGDVVAIESHIFDGVCRPCRTGNAHVCENLRILGIDVSGGFAEYAAVPSRLAWRVPPTIPLERAVLFEPLGNAVHAAMRYDVSGQPVAVYGCGPMGLMAIAVAYTAGAYPIVATDVSAYRRTLAEQVGAHLTVDAARPSVEQDIVDALGERPTVSLEMSGHPTALRQALRVSANAGKIVFLGIPPKPIVIDLAEEFMFKGLEAYGVTGRLIWDTWYRTEAFLQIHGDLLEPLVTHTFPLRDFEDAMQLVLSGDCGKVLLDVDG